MESKDSGIGDSECLPTSESLVSKSFGGKFASSLLLRRSNVPDSELTEVSCPVCSDSRRKFLYEENEYSICKCLGCTHIYVSPQPSKSF